MQITRIQQNTKPSFGAKIPTDVILDFASHHVYENPRGRDGLHDAAKAIVGKAKVEILGFNTDVFFDCIDAFRKSIPDFEQIRQSAHNLSLKDRFYSPEKVREWVAKQKNLLENKEEFEVESLPENPEFEKLKKQTHVIKHY